MKRSIQRWLSSVMVPVVISVFSAQAATTPEHILPMKELQGLLQSASAERSKNIEDIQRVLSHPAATAALEKSKISPEQMRAAVATLDDSELARFSDRARASEKDVEGGIVVGMLALIGLIVVIIIVIAVVAEARPAPQTQAVQLA